MSSNANANTNAAAPRAPHRLTLEEKLWMDRRRNDIEYCSGVGGALGAAATAAITAFGPFPRRVQFFAIAGGVLIGGSAGYLYADSKALERVQDLSASSTLRKQYQQIEMEKKATKASK
ncbi:hypothetical protein PF005_g22402 [Phytophthora fragariae]|uniref:Uncharacterized protein n=1 Tax=Phytophthora fragariae TaxID=53985 RepID=A0A6A3WI35_9STRA|nr:hypothetical protein PF003_g25216 [Phytophthora fragariae]KAE8930535.1 hypothetical protein PF009_g19377 [Phytophthora fragariae]KAE8984162.1 hypothetical protein PF011_g20889 [Phytophthora fragariae]KAE9081777.1 hypothetical protein PF010_g21861 [Phytophthora fragariae]KAE9091982.1 hypothetical protein PF007_g18691 [Phytophthora fragariae]